MLITNEDIVGSILPKPYVSRIMLQSAGSEPNKTLVTNLQIVLKEQFENDNISSWLEDSQLLSFLKVSILQSVDEQMTTHLLNFLEMQNSRNLNDGFFFDFKNYLEDRSIFTTLPNLRNKIFYEEINLYNQLAFSLSALIQQGKAERVDNSDGSKSYNIYLDVSFSPPNLTNNPEHLSFLICTNYDLTSLLNELGNSVSSDDLKGISDVTLETVINNGELAAKSYVYVDDNLNVWPGQIHLSSDGVTIRSGLTETQNSVNLTILEIDNYKIQDFRVLKRLLDVQLFDLKVTDVFFNKYSPENIEKELIAQKNNSCISDVFPSVDVDGNTALTFFIDFKNMFKINSSYGRILASMDTQISNNFINRAYRMATIDTIRIKAKRIDIDDSLIPKKQTEITVAEFSSLLDIQKIEKEPSLTALDDNLKRQIRMFTFKLDSKLAKGAYQFSVEIVYHDRFLNIIQQIIDRLLGEKNKFLQYYLKASSPAAFNQKTNRFNNNAFFNFPLTEITDFTYSGKVYIQALSELYSIQLGTDTITIINNWLNPIQGTPTTIWNVLKLYEDMIGNLEKLSNSTKFVNNSLNEKNEGILDFKSSINSIPIITIKKQFNNILNLNTDFKLEYLDFNKQSSQQSPVYSDVSYEDLKLDIISKKIDNNFEIKFNSSQEQAIDSVYNKSKNILSNFLNLEVTKALTAPPPENYSNTARSLQNSLQTLRGLQTIEQFAPGTSITDTEKQILNSLFLTLLNPTIDRNSENDTVFLTTTQNSENIFWSIRPDKANVFGSRVADLFLGTEIEKTAIRDLPNQIKFLLKNKISSPDLSFNDARIRLKTEMLKQVVYLRGFPYDQATGFKMCEPIWTRLRDLNIFRNSNEVIFCRLMDYNNPTIKYKFNNCLKQLCTNEYFTINQRTINDFGLITDGATKINTTIFEGRSTFETDSFFAPEDRNINLIIDGKVLNPDDSLNTSKYSFFSPIGVHFENVYKTLQFRTPQVVIDFMEEIPITITPDLSVPNNITYVYETYQFPTTTTLPPPKIAIDKINAKNAAIYSKNDNLRINSARVESVSQSSRQTILQGLNINGIRSR